MGVEWLFDFVTSPLLGGYETHDEHETGSESKIETLATFLMISRARTIVLFVMNMRSFVLITWVI